MAKGEMMKQCVWFAAAATVTLAGAAHALIAPGPVGWSDYTTFMSEASSRQHDQCLCMSNESAPGIGNVSGIIGFVAANSMKNNNSGLYYFKYFCRVPTAISSESQPMPNGPDGTMLCSQFQVLP